MSSAVMLDMQWILNTGSLPYIHRRAKAYRKCDGAIESVSIANLRPGDIVRSTTEADFKTLAKVIKFLGGCSDFVRFGSGSLGRAMNVPSGDLLLSSNAILARANHKPIDAENLINGNSISRVRTEQPADAFLFCTVSGDYILLDDVPVATLSLDDWYAYLETEAAQQLRWGEWSEESGAWHVCKNH